MLLALAAIWGASFLLLKIGAPVLGPITLIEVRVALAAGALALFAVLTGRGVRLRHRWWQYLVLGAVNAALPFTLIATAELRLASGVAAILNATTPMFTAIWAWAWQKEPLTPAKVSGVFLGIVGVAVLVGAGAGGQDLWTYAGLSLLAAFSYGFAGVFAVRHLRGERPLDMAVGQQAGAALWLVVPALLVHPAGPPGAFVALSVLVLAIVCTAAAYLLYFSLIQSVGAVRTLTVTFLVPVFAVLWGALALGEGLTLNMLLGLAIILASVALVAGTTRRRGAEAPRAPAGDA